ncbi:MAG: hypothetical protein II797_02620 [Clostridia bacterium]|nr:hypothetical protein [Clostridia bacterium]
MEEIKNEKTVKAPEEAPAEKDQEKVIASKGREVKAPEKKAFDLLSLIELLLGAVFTVGMTILTVWLEYTWLSGTLKHSWDAMNSFWFTVSGGVNRPLFFSLVLCGLVVWGMVAFALSVLIKKLIKLISGKITLNAKNKEKAHK